MSVRLIAQNGPAKGQAVEIRSRKFFIGSHENCHLRPAMAEIGTIHALIEERESRILLRDLNTEQGTLVNGRTVHDKEIDLADGDLIKIGPLELLLDTSETTVLHSPVLKTAPPGWPLGDLSAVAPRKVATAPVSAAPTPILGVTPPAAPAQAPARTILGVMPTLAPAASAATPTPPLGRVEAPIELPASVIASAIAKPARHEHHPHGHERGLPKTSSLDCHRARDKQDVLVLTMHGPILEDERTVAPLRYDLHMLLEHPLPRNEVVDLGHVQRLSSRAVGVLLAHYQGLVRKGGEMRVCGISEGVQPALAEMRLERLVDVFPTVEEAVKSTWDEDEDEDEGKGDPGTGSA